MATEQIIPAGTPVPPPAPAGADDAPVPMAGSAPAPPSGMVRRVGDQAINLAQGVIGVPESFTGLADLATGGQVGKALENPGGSFGFRPKEARDYLQTFKSPEQQAAEANLSNADGFVDTVKAAVMNPSATLGTAVQSAPTMVSGGIVSGGVMKGIGLAEKVAPTMVPAIARGLGFKGGVAEAAPVIAGAIGEGATAAGQNAEQVRQEDPNGTLTGTQSAILAGSGALTAGLGGLAGKVAQHLGIGKAETIIASKTAPAVEQTAEEAAAAAAKKGVDKGTLRKIGEGALVDGVLQEFPQSYQEQVAQNIAQGKPWDEGAMAAGVQGAFAGGLTGGIAGPLEGHAEEKKAAAPPPPSGPFTAALLGLPQPSSTITVGPDGAAATSTQTSDAANAAAAQTIANGGISDTTPTAGVQPSPIDVAAQHIASPDAANETPIVPLELKDSREPRQLAYNQASDADQAAYNSVFGAHDDITDVEAKHKSPVAAIVDNVLDKDIPFTREESEASAAGSGGDAAWMKGLGFTDQEIAHALAETPDRAPEETAASASGGGKSAPAAAPDASPATQRGAGDSQGGTSGANAQAAAPGPVEQAEAAAPKGKAAAGGGAAPKVPSLVEHVTGKGKTIKGVIRSDLTFPQAKAIDPLTFKKNGGFFIREAHLNKLEAAHPTPGAAPAAQVTAKTTPAAAPAEDEKTAQWRRTTSADRGAIVARAGFTGFMGQRHTRTAMEKMAPQVRAKIQDAMTEDGRAKPPEAKAPTAAVVKAPTAAVVKAAAAEVLHGAGSSREKLDQPKTTLANVSSPSVTRRMGPDGDRQFVARAWMAPDYNKQATGLGKTHDEAVQNMLHDADSKAPAPSSPVAKTQPAPSSPVKATVFSDEAAQAARERIKARLAKMNPTAGESDVHLDIADGAGGIDHEMMADGIMLAGNHIEKGARTFADFAKAMVADMGPGVKPYLKSWYMGVKFDPRAGAFEGMDKAGDVEAADVEEATKPGTDVAAIDAQAHEAATSPTNDLPEPTLAQKEAGNYKKGHISVQGMDITVENPRGSTRTGTRPDGSTWSHEMSDHYGYVKGTVGADGEQVDVYVGQHPDAPHVYVVDQVNKDGAFDEHKAMIGFNSEAEARAAYSSNFDDKWTVGAVTPLTVDEFKGWLQTPASLKPLSKATPISEHGTLTQHFYEAIKADGMPANNIQLSRMVTAFDGAIPTPARMKQAQEALEAAISMKSRDIVEANRKEGPKTTFGVLTRAYANQPNLNVRTSTSVANQAYSTPAPLAYLASNLAGITPKSTVYEPTAGTGMLLIGANPKNTSLNELNADRRALLKEQGFPIVTPHDASDYTPKGRFDAVIANPPFGSIKNAKGEPIKVDVDGFKIGQIDHLIAARALEAMNPDGSATLIIGANKVPGGLSNDDRIFFNWLYSHYNVTSQFEVAGPLYARQGAAWPVRVITINGREQSTRVSPAPGVIPRADTWEQVYGQYERGLDAGRQSLAGRDGRALGAVQPEAGAGSVRGDVGAAPAVAYQPGPESGAGGDGNVTRAGAEPAADSGRQPIVPVGNADSEQRLGAEPTEPDRLGATGSPAARARSEPKVDTGATSLASAENQFQATYVARSSRKDANVLIPVNMKEPTQLGLSKVEDAVGDIDQYAAKELGYPNVDALHDALMGLQVDSVASAIYQNTVKGKGIVIADQTGIGKGRQAAAMIRWAKLKGYTPVFVSVKPSLFTDMYGDLHDIGTDDIAPLIMNREEHIAGPNGEKLFANKASKHSKVLQTIAETGKLPEGSNALFMTYSQINQENIQRKAVMALAPNAFFVLDESHNAAGESNTGEFVQGALDGAKGVTYLSATYAKRPDNMPLYSKTDIGEAAADNEGLMQAMAAGGLPLQTVVANNLVKAGQMFRRERSFDGVTFDTKVDTENRTEHEKKSDQATLALRAIVQADHMFHESHFKEVAKAMAAEGKRALDSVGNNAAKTVTHTEFSSVVHNFVRQMLLGLKAQTAAENAIADIKAGKKPIIAVENTMGSFLNEYAAAKGLKPGDSLGAYDYRVMLSRALARTRFMTFEDGKGNKERREVKLSELGALTRTAYERAQEVIDGLKLDIPASPIDWMRQQITNAGHTVSEITGRANIVDYSDPKNPKLAQLSEQEQHDKVQTTRLFNAGTVDALVLNVAGSTGISLHASEKFADQRERVMTVAQAAGDINIFMQMLGRIHRTGQVALPGYRLLSADLPTEKRPSAVLSKKMKSLNANTSSNTESATSVQAGDILNKYGDQIVNDYLLENPALARELRVTVGEIGDAPEDLARTATGRLALQPIAVQEAFYKEVEERYTGLINYLNDTNQNDLEPRTFDYDARAEREETLFEGQDPESPFGQDAIYGEYSIKAQGVPMKPAEIRAAINENTGGKSTADHIVSTMAPLTLEANKYIKSLPEDQQAQAMLTRNVGMAFMDQHAIGKTFRVDINGEPYNAVVTNIRNTHKGAGNPFAMSKIQVSIAVNGSLRTVTVPASQFQKIEQSEIGRGYSIEQLFKEQPANQRETAKIVTGNLLAAYGEIKGTRGTIVNFSKADGTTEQGILLPKIFSFAKDTRQDFRLKSGADALSFLQQSQNADIGRFGIQSRDSLVRVLPDGKGIEIKVPKSKAKGAKYFLDKDLIGKAGEFTSSGNSMVARVADPKNAAAALDILMKKNALYTLPSMAEEAKQITGEGSDKLDISPPVAQQGAATAPATAEHQAKAETLNASLNAGILSGSGGTTFHAVEPGAEEGSTESHMLKAAQFAAKRLFGQDVVYVKFDGKKMFNGAVSGEVPNTIFVDINAERPQMAVLGHELTHVMRTNFPALYKAMDAALMKLYKPGAPGGYYEKIRAKYESNGMRAPRDWDEEMNADIVGDHFMDPEFWKAFSNQFAEPSQARMFAQVVMRAIDRIKAFFGKAALKPFQTEQYLSDLDAARAAVAQGMAAFSTAQTTTPGAGPVAGARSFMFAAPEKAQIKAEAENAANADPHDAPMFDLVGDPAKLMAAAREKTQELFNTPGKLNWWHKTVGSPYNLAQRSPLFKAVFDHVQDFLKDVSKYASETADTAPNLLPKLEKLSDLKKSPVTAKDSTAISKPIFEGTLSWGRDERGQPIRMKDLEETYASMSPKDKAGVMLRKGLVAENELKRWQALPIDSYNGSVNNRFDATVLKPGIVWTPAELKSRFGLDDKQVGLYQEFRKATDKSLTDLAVSDMVRTAGKDVDPIKQMAMDAGDAQAAGVLLRDHLLAMADQDPDARRSNALRDTANTMIEKADRVKALQDRGYAPLSRFGKYTVDVVGKDGERQYFSLYEDRFSAAKAAAQLKAAYPDSTITRGTMSEEQYKLFQGVSPETAELFGNMLGLDQNADTPSGKAFQQYLKLAKNNRSTMKRLIERKGIAGFSDDPGRVLASFAYSNARQTSNNLHAGEIAQSVSDIPQQQGELKDAASKLKDYVSNPQQEAAGFRGLLFTQYIGGSIASAMVNLTQPLQTTLPYLSQFGGIKQAAGMVKNAARDALRPDKALEKTEPDLYRALQRAEEEGTVSPQEVHQLMAQARGSETLKAGDGTKLGNAQAAANNAFSRIQFGWGKLFSTAEQFNRRLTFIASYRTAKANGMNSQSAFAFAEKAISETQFVANKGNRPRWARGAVGSTLFTFKSYSVNYLEMVARMAQNGPEGRKAAALALGTLMLMSGAGGLPFSDDINDLIDAIAQRLGYNFNTKAKRTEFLQGLFGQAGGDFVDKGVSGISGFPLDLSGRMGMGNLIPGTGLLTAKADHTSDVAELFGPAGDLAKRTFQSAGQLVDGKFKEAAFGVAPKAITNLRQGANMAQTGAYSDSKGRKVLETNGAEAFSKAIGFQPSSVAQVQDATGQVQNAIAQQRLVSADIAQTWSAGIAQKDADMVKQAQDQLRAWNAKNPDARITPSMAAIQTRARQMNQDKATRLEKTAPKGMRADIRSQLAQPS